MEMDDSEAIKNLTLEWTKAQPGVSRFIRSFVRNQADAEDLIQEVALTIVDRYASYDPSRPFSPWAFGIARNLVKAHFRKQLKQLPGSEDETAVDRVADAFETLQPQLEDMKEALAGCMQKLPPADRTILALHYDEELKPHTIAERLGQSANYVAVQLYRMRKNLRRCVERSLNLPTSTAT
jgi:RNA polymerase sigma-70 factor, ECF subfamily